MYRDSMPRSQACDDEEEREKEKGRKTLVKQAEIKQKHADWHSKRKIHRENWVQGEKPEI